MSDPAAPRDDDLIQAVVDEHGAALWSFALRCSNGDRHGAEDLVQETLVRAWQHPEALDGSHGVPRTWLFSVVRNLAIDRYRRERRRPALVGAETTSRDLAGMHGSASMGPSTAVADRDRTDLDGAPPWTVHGSDLESVGGDQIDKMVDIWMVRAALDQLTPVHREVLQLIVGGDASVAQAAHALGIPPGTVKSRVFYALRALRLMLEEMGYCS